MNPADRWLGAELLARDGSVTYSGFGDGVMFLMRLLEAETEITDPIPAKLYVSPETTDTDRFLVMRVFTPSMREDHLPGSP